MEVKAPDRQTATNYLPPNANSAPGIASKIRMDFPILNRRLHGHNLVYLDSAATTQKPRQVLQRVSTYYEQCNANVHRTLHSLGSEATAAYEDSRCKVQQFINASSTAEIIFTRGATEGINLVAASWGRANLKAGDEILLTEMEHHSNLIPWQLLAGEKGCVLRFIPVLEDGTLDLDALDGLLNERTRLVAVGHVSNVFGTINDIARIVRCAHGRGVPVLIDSAQGVPHLPLDVRKLDCDFLTFSGHKMCGPMGIGVLYGRQALLAAMPPYMGGGEMIQSVWLDHATWAESPQKFEAGTPNVGGAIGLGAAIDYLGDLGMESIANRESELTAYALARLRTVPGLEIYGAAKHRTGVIAFNLDHIHAHDVAQYLDQAGIAVRAGHHCAQPLMRKLGVAATVRASLYLYNTRAEIDRLVDALIETKGFFNHGI